jgi:ABC-type glycerol-3-phosphate transport system substrate-binding protein
MLKHFFRTSAVVYAILTVTLSACAAPTPQVVEKVVEKPVIQTQVVEKQVVQTQVVEKTVVQTQVVEKVVTPTSAPKPAGAKKVLNFWSMWSTQPLNQQFVQTVVNDYVKAHPDVQINLSFWEKAALDQALQAALKAGEGVPDMAGDTNSTLFAKAGWLLNLDGALPKDAFKPGILEAATMSEPKGVYGYPIGIQLLYLLYNPQIFQKLGIQVPANYQFTQDQFVDVVNKCNAAGYSGVANAVADRNYPAEYPIWGALVQLVGPDQESKLDGGNANWDTPETRQVLTWLDKARLAGMWPKNFTTMGIDAFHVYFHTQQKACMMYIGSFYPARAFKSVDLGGQSPDFHVGALRYPLMTGAKYPDYLWSAFDSGFVGFQSTKYPEVVKDFYAFMSQPKYGALWSALTTQPSTLKFDVNKDWPAEVKDAAQWKWYWDEINKVYGSANSKLTVTTPCGSFTDAATAVLNTGLPQGLITVDDGIKKLNAALCTK